MRKHIRVPAPSGGFGLLVREAGQTAILTNRWKEPSKARYNAFAQLFRHRMIRHLDPSLKSSGVRFNSHCGRKPSPVQIFHGFRIERINEQQLRTVKRPKIDVAALGVHALEPRHALYQLRSVPLPLRLPPGLRADDHDFVPLGPHCTYLGFDGFKASIAGRRCSAICAASKRFTTTGGASQSQNALTRAAVKRPVVTTSR